MRRIIFAALISILVISTIPPVGSARAAESPLTVLLTYPDKEYEVRDVVTVSVHVFRYSARFDPDEVDLRVGVNLTSRPLERQSTGLYEASVEILESDLGEAGSLRLEVTTEKAGPYPEMDEFSTWLRLPERPILRVGAYLVDPTTAFPEAGQVVQVLVVCQYGDQLVDAEPGSVYASVEGSSSDFQERIDLTRVSRGLYTGNWTVSVDMNVTDMYYLRGRAKFGSGSVDTYGSSLLFISPIDVWINFKDVSTSAIVADVHVCTQDPEPVEGARVSVEVRLDNSQDIHDVLVMETGPEGVANLLLDLEGVEPTPFEVSFRMDVQGEGISHEASWILATDHMYASPGFRKDGLGVVLLDQPPIPAGSQLTLHLMATDHAEPLRNTTIDCYLYMVDRGFVASAEARTDGDGLFQLDLSIPEIPGSDEWTEMMTGLFKARTGGAEDWTMTSIRVSDVGSWAEWYDKNAPGTTMDVASTPSPDRYTVTLRSDVADGRNETVMIQWRVGNDDWYWGTTDPGWYPLTYDGYIMVPVGDLSWNGETYVGTIQVPDFLPEDAVISVSGYVKDHLDPEGMGWAYIEDLYLHLDDPPPEVEITSPRDGELVEGGLVVRGTASDDGPVQSVLVRLDGGEWETAEGTEVWEFEIREGDLGKGSHTIEAMSFDGSRYSEVHRIEIDYNEVHPQAMEPWPFIVLLVLLTGAVVTVYSMRRRRGGPGP